MDTARFRTIMLFLMCGAFAQGCSRTTATPAAPSPQTVSGMTRDRTSYTFLKWDEGLAVMLVDQCDAHHMSGSNTSGGPCHRKGDASWWDDESGQWKDGYEWQLKTTDGCTAVFTINNVEYDLINGGVFRIEINGDETTVLQLPNDLSNVRPNDTSCTNFVKADPKLTKTEGKSNSE